MKFIFTHKGSLDKTEKFLKGIQKLDIRAVAEGQAKRGVSALSAATPRDSGRVAGSWGYTVESNSNTTTITWTNSDIENGFPVAIMLQYGHGTGTGGYISGRDYINPAMKPVFDSIAETVWRAVKAT